MTVREAAPLGLKKLGRQVAAGFGHHTARWRPMPDFLLVGAQRCGTTSLFRALLAHPAITSATFHKGVNYFDVNYAHGPLWYRGHFPVDLPARARTTFEASGYYMFHPHAPRRIVADLPQVRIVAMVRDPVERAYSAHQHERSRGFETEDFATALALEDARVEPALARMLADEHVQEPAHRHQAYRRRGHYVDQLRPFLEGLGPDRVHLIESERFFQEPAKEYARLLEFLEVPSFTPPRFDRYNAHRRAPMAEEVRRELTAYFRPHDEALAELLDRTPVWRA